MGGTRRDAPPKKAMIVVAGGCRSIMSANAEKGMVPGSKWVQRVVSQWRLSTYAWPGLLTPISRRCGCGLNFKIVWICTVDCLVGFRVSMEFMRLSEGCEPHLSGRLEGHSRKAGIGPIPVLVEGRRGSPDCNILFGSASCEI
jgi:hypothetical protein